MLWNSSVIQALTCVLTRQNPPPSVTVQKYCNKDEFYVYFGGCCIWDRHVELFLGLVSSVITQPVGVCIMMRSQGEQGSRLRPTDTIVISPPVEPPGRLLTFFTIHYLTFNNQTMTWHQAASKAAPQRLEKLLTRLNFFIVTPLSFSKLSLFAGGFVTTSFYGTCLIYSYRYSWGIKGLDKTQFME